MTVLGILAAHADCAGLERSFWAIFLLKNFFLERVSSINDGYFDVFVVNDARCFQLQDAAVEWSVLCLLNSFPPASFAVEAMTSLVQIFRFLVGLGLVVAGGFVVSPFVSSVVSAASRENLSRGFLKQNDTVNRTGTLRSTPNSFTVPQ